MKKFKLSALLTSVFLSFAVFASASGSAAPINNNVKVSPMWKMQKLAATSSPTGYSPAQIKKAYGFGSNFATGKGKTIAIIAAYGDPNLKSDVAAFSSKYGLPAAKLTIHDCGVNNTDDDWAVETALDTEWAHAMAPNANIMVVDAASEDSDDLLNAVDYATSNGAQIVSMSWGSNENISQTQADSHFVKNGIVFVAASGDDGAGAIWPASSVNVISVGGTTLRLSSSGSVISETAWSSSGGGVSFLEAEPTWQSNIGINSYSRVSPDVSFDANTMTGVSVYCSASNDGSAHWYNVGGTSLGAPSWAGLIADLNQNVTYIKNAGSFYTIAGGTSYKNTGKCFNDITMGGNGYRASTGYDAVTGLGSPNASGLAAQALANKAALTSASYTVTTTTIPSPVRVPRGFNNHRR